MSRLSFERAVSWSVRMTLAGVFAYAGWAKLKSPQLFTATVVRLQLVPFSWSEWVASALPVAELLIGVWLLRSFRLRAAALAAMWLAASFLFAMAQAYLRGLDLDCHCFGVTDSPLPPAWVLARATAVMAAGVFLWMRSRPQSSSRSAA